MKKTGCKHGVRFEPDGKTVVCQFCKEEAPPPAAVKPRKPVPPKPAPSEKWGGRRFGIKGGGVVVSARVTSEVEERLRAMAAERGIPLATLAAELLTSAAKAA